MDLLHICMVVWNYGGKNKGWIDRVLNFWARRYGDYLLGELGLMLTLSRSKAESLALLQLAQSQSKLARLRELFLRHPTTASRNLHNFFSFFDTASTEYLIRSLILVRKSELIKRIDGVRAIDKLIGTVRKWHSRDAIALYTRSRNYQSLITLHISLPQIQVLVG
jgi:hypothetical protein